MRAPPAANVAADSGTQLHRGKRWEANWLTQHTRVSP